MRLERPRQAQRVQQARSTPPEQEQGLSEGTRPPSAPCLSLPRWYMAARTTHMQERASTRVPALRWHASPHSQRSGKRRGARQASHLHRPQSRQMMESDSRSREDVVVVSLVEEREGKSDKLLFLVKSECCRCLRVALASQPPRESGGGGGDEAEEDVGELITDEGGGRLASLDGERNLCCCCCFRPEEDRCLDD